MGVNIGWCDAEIRIFASRNVKVRFTQTGTGASQVITIAQKSQSIPLKAGNQCYFQFGRKDPMLPINLTASGSNTDKTSYSGSYPFKVSKTSKVAIGTSIQNPNIFYGCGNSSPYDWCANSYYNLWSADNTVTTANDNVVVKTVYDPSPVGYHLPASNAFTGFTSTGQSVSGTSNFRSMFNSPYISDADYITDFGWEFYCNKMNGEGNCDTTGGTIFFLASGNRHFTMSIPQYVSKFGYYWAAVARSIENGCYLTFDSSSVSPVSSTYRGFGNAIRPCRERE